MSYENTIDILQKQCKEHDMAAEDPAASAGSELQRVDSGNRAHACMMENDELKTQVEDLTNRLTAAAQAATEWGTAMADTGGGGGLQAVPSVDPELRCDTCVIDMPLTYAINLCH